MTALRASAGVGEPGRAVNPVPRAESVRIAPRPSYVDAHGNEQQRRLRFELERYLATRDGGWCCFYCGVSGVKFHLDHVTPREHGGPDDADNLVLSCRACNLRKRTTPGWFFVLVDGLGIKAAPRYESVAAITQLLCPACLSPLAAARWNDGLLTCGCGHVFARSRSTETFRSAVAVSVTREA